MGTLYICKIFYAWTTIYLKIPNLVKFFQSNSAFLCFVIKLKFIHNEFYVLVFCHRTKVSSQPRFYVFLSPITKLEKKSWFAFQICQTHYLCQFKMAWIIFLYVLLILTSLKFSKSSWFARFEVFFALVNVALWFPSWLCVFCRLMPLSSCLPLWSLPPCHWVLKMTFF